MPYAPLKPCAQPGCPLLIPSGQTRCDQHGKEFTRAYERSRGTPAQRGYDSQWRRVREKALQRDGYICQGQCKEKGRITPATTVHHVVAFEQGNRRDPRRLDINNLVSLCQPCHSRIDGWVKNYDSTGTTPKPGSFEDWKKRFGGK
jgi:5-methylcytosine-specific restriction protein A